MTHPFRFLLAASIRQPGWGLAWLLVVGGWNGMIRADGMPEQLRELADQHGFEISGFDLLSGGPARRTTGPPRNQIRILLENYNYILVGTPDGGVERVIIMGGKQALPEQPSDAAKTRPKPSATDEETNEIVVPTQRQESHHLVDSELVGPPGTKVKLALTVDTGASSVVLPVSTAEKLGFTLEDLSKREVKTANGTAEASVGTLAQVQLGDAVVEDVEVAFIDDEQLGGAALLGMSVLGRFHITLDDEENQLTLRHK